MSNRIVLLGDSIFDNQAYTEGEPDVVSHLRQLLPSSWEATLCAVDGATMSDLKTQCGSVPSDISHVVVSVGGNDAMMNSDLLGIDVASTAESLSVFGKRISLFETQYRAALEEVSKLGRPVTTCTIYNGCFPVEEAGLIRTALMTFNDVILRVAFEHRFTVIDLRYVCQEPEDYANPIEPSGTGGRKIAEAIAHAVGAVDGTDCYSRIYSG